MKSSSVKLPGIVRGQGAVVSAVVRAASIGLLLTALGVLVGRVNSGITVHAAPADTASAIKPPFVDQSKILERFLRRPWARLAAISAGETGQKGRPSIPCCDAMANSVTPPLRSSKLSACRRGLVSRSAGALVSSAFSWPCRNSGI